MSDQGSILKETKNTLGISEDLDEFDTDVMLHINNAFFALRQLGVGPAKALYIDSEATKWNEFTLDDSIGAVKSYIWASVRLAFDPPENSWANDALEKQKQEAQYRLMVDAEERRYPYDELERNRRTSRTVELERRAGDYYS